MIEYPKIHSLYKREGHDFNINGVKPKNGRLLIEEYACEEFASIDRWILTEKVDGTNIRICMDKRIGSDLIEFGGRTKDALIPATLMTHLQRTFTFDKMNEVFEDSNYVVLFGEGYGPKIQSGGYYRKDQGFILFDIFCSGWWLNRSAIEDIATQLGIPCVPLLHDPNHQYLWKKEDIVKFVQGKYLSDLALNTSGEIHEMEGIVARSEPLMMFRKGGPIMFKLKCRDFYNTGL
jgi:ATP-dependent RNA circularization protein (DNA/RNA ligase family)